jgi:hypothetical protein
VLKISGFPLRFPGRDLAGMNVELLRKPHNRSIAFDRRKGHLPVCGSGAVVASWFLLIRRHQRARCQAEIPLIALCKIPKPSLVRHGVLVITYVEPGIFRQP